MARSWWDIREGWSDFWYSNYRSATEQYDDAIEADPQRFAKRVEVSLGHLTAADAVRRRLKAAIANPVNGTVVVDADRTNYLELNKRYHTLAAGIYVDARPVDHTAVAPPEIGGRPAREEDDVGVADVHDPILTVAGLELLTTASIAWAVYINDYAENLHEQLGIQEHDLNARLAAAGLTGSTPSSAPPAPPATTTGASMGTGTVVAIGVLGVVVVGVGIYLVSRK